MINVFIVDDHPLIIEGILTALKLRKDKIRVMDTATSCSDLMNKIRPDLVDVILLDLVMPKTNGIEYFKMIKKRIPDIKVIALTGELDSHKLLEAWMVGINAIMPKYCDGKELATAIGQVYKGQRFLGQGLPDIFKTANIARDDKVPKLTKREEEVLRLLAVGHKRREVADKLGIATDSVNFHCKNLFKKFNRKSIKEVLYDAKEYNIIP